MEATEEERINKKRNIPTCAEVVQLLLKTSVAKSDTVFERKATRVPSKPACDDHQRTKITITNNNNNNNNNSYNNQNNFTTKVPNNGGKINRPQLTARCSGHFPPSPSFPGFEYLSPSRV